MNKRRRTEDREESGSDSDSSSSSSSSSPSSSSSSSSVPTPSSPRPGRAFGLRPPLRSSLELEAVSSPADRIRDLVPLAGVEVSVRAFDVRARRRYLVIARDGSWDAHGVRGLVLTRKPFRATRATVTGRGRTVALAMAALDYNVAWAVRLAPWSRRESDAARAAAAPAVRLSLAEDFSSSRPNPYSIECRNGRVVARFSGGLVTTRGGEIEPHGVEGARVRLLSTDHPRLLFIAVEADGETELEAAAALRDKLEALAGRLPGVRTCANIEVPLARPRAYGSIAPTEREPPVVAEPNAPALTSATRDTVVHQMSFTVSGLCGRLTGEGATRTPGVMHVVVKREMPGDAVAVTAVGEGATEEQARERAEVAFRAWIEAAARLSHEGFEGDEGPTIPPGIIVRRPPHDGAAEDGSPGAALWPHDVLCEQDEVTVLLRVGADLPRPVSLVPHGEDGMDVQREGPGDKSFTILSRCSARTEAQALALARETIGEWLLGSGMPAEILHPLGLVPPPRAAAAT